MTSPDAVILSDVDSTLLESDRVEKDLRRHLERKFGAENRNRFLAIVEELRAELGCTDYFGPQKRYPLQDRGDPRLLTLGRTMPTGGKWC